MVLATLHDCARYTTLHPAFARAFEFLSLDRLAGLSPGRHPIIGDELYVSIDHMEGRGRESARLEAHRKYIDIQVTIDGTEEIGWKALDHCRRPAGNFSEDKDVGFYDDTPLAWFAVPPGHFALFFPNDAHAPLCGRGPMKKAIVKVLVG